MVIADKQEHFFQGLCILGNPHMTSFAIGAQNKEVSIHALADHMEAKGIHPLSHISTW